VTVYKLQLHEAIKSPEADELRVFTEPLVAVGKAFEVLKYLNSPKAADAMAFLGWNFREKRPFVLSAEGINIILQTIEVCE